nr:DNA repair protein [Legionella jordanis]
MEHSLLFFLMLAFGLGIRHGLDLDHLATIDCISRTIPTHDHLSRQVGVLFSFGHGVVVIIASLILAKGVTEAPVWLETSGKLISQFFLLALGGFSLWQLLTPSMQTEKVLKNHWLAHCLPKRFNRLMIIGIGGLFALSFDTFSQVIFFSVSASIFTHWWIPLWLGVLFTMGMMSADGINGWLISTLIRKAKERSILLSRLLSLVIAGFSLSLGIFEFLK